MELPPQFTGYNSKISSYRDFQALCFHLQNIGSLKVLKTSKYEYPKNYFAAFVENTESRFWIVQNCFVPYIAFAEKHTSGQFTFIEKLNIKVSMESFNSDLKILPVSELNEAIGQDHLSQLNNDEETAVKRCLPTTVGDVLFSWFFD